MLAGEIERCRERIARLEAESARLQEKLDALDAALALTDVPLDVDARPR